MQLQTANMCAMFWQIIPNNISSLVCLLSTVDIDSAPNFMCRIFGRAWASDVLIRKL
jgi:hypothetical protein